MITPLKLLTACEGKNPYVSTNHTLGRRIYTRNKFWNTPPPTPRDWAVGEKGVGVKPLQRITKTNPLPCPARPPAQQSP